VRACDLLGRVVVDTAGRRRGVVVELVASQQGPAILVEGLVVSPHRLGSMLGYGRQQQRGPLLVRGLVERLHRSSVVVPWSSVLGVGRAVVVEPTPWA